MPIDRVELRHVRMPYVFPFETSFDREDTKDCLLLRVWVDGVEGWGESPVTMKPYYKEETVETAWPILAGFIIPRVLGRTKIAVGMSVGIESTIDAVLRRIETWLAQGYRRIKVKIKPGFDVALVKAIRERFGGIPLQVDANSAYTLHDLPRLRELDEYDLLMIEQPLDHDDIIDHAMLQRGLRTPICLDESIASGEDARKAIELGACRIINIKAARMGGLSEGLHCHEVCLARGIPVWCGGLLETGIGRAANIALASLPNFTLPADMGASRRYFHEDVIDPWVEVNPDGLVDVPTGPGLGFTVVERLVDKYTQRKETFRAA